MNDIPYAQVERYGRNLAAEAYPKADDLPGSLGFRRKWVLRLRASLPSDEELLDAIRSFEYSARREVSNAMGIQGELMNPLPAVSATQLDSHHLVLEIDCPNAAAGMGDAAAIATSVMLRAADQRWQLEDLQGIPKRYWFIVS
jgi:hypothetical protein